MIILWPLWESKNSCPGIGQLKVIGNRGGGGDGVCEGVENE